MAMLQIVRLLGWLLFLLHFFIRFFSILFLCILFILIFFIIIIRILLILFLICIIFITVFRLLFILILFHYTIFTLLLIFIHWNLFFLLEHLLRHSPVNCHSSAKKLSSISSLNSSTSILYFLELYKGTTHHPAIRLLEYIYIYHRAMWREELLQRIL